jgi:hypothetical protein
MKAIQLLCIMLVGMISLTVTGATHTNLEQKGKTVCKNEINAVSGLVELNTVVMENVNFGQAIEALKEGKRVARQGWNGKNMFIFQRPADEVNIRTVVENVKSLPESVKKYFDSIDDRKNPGEFGLRNIKFTSYLCMKAADGSIVNGWLASQTDMLSNDRCILD